MKFMQSPYKSYAERDAQASKILDAILLCASRDDIETLKNEFSNELNNLKNAEASYGGETSYYDFVMRKITEKKESLS